MTSLNWGNVKAMPWRQRNASVEVALKIFLGQMPATLTFSTMELAARLVGAEIAEDKRPDETAAAVAKLLSRMAPYMAPLASHDGETIIRYGRKRRRWRWHGQAKE